MTPEDWLRLRWIESGESPAPGMVKVADRLRPRGGAVFIRKEARDASERRALAREAALLARLSHAGLRRLAAVADGRSRTVAILEHVEGLDLGAHLGAKPEDALACAVSLLRVLVYLHGGGRAHGDLKPANVLVEHDGRVRLIDLGLVVPLGAQPLGGTARFLAPEYEAGAPASVAGDLYAFGRALEDAGGQNIVAHWPSALRECVAACSRENAAERPASAEALLARLGATPGPLDRVGEIPRSERDPAFRDASRELERRVGATVVVVAPPGSGRTRLARDLARRAWAAREAVADVAIEPGDVRELDALAAVLGERDIASAIERAGREEVAVVVDVGGAGDPPADVVDALAAGARALRALGRGALVVVGASAACAARAREDGGAIEVAIETLDREGVAAMARAAGARANDRVIDAILAASEGRAGRVAKASMALAEAPELGLDVIEAIARGEIEAAPSRATATATDAEPVEVIARLAETDAAEGRVVEAEARVASLGGAATPALRLSRSRWLERLGRYDDARRVALTLTSDHTLRAAAAVVFAQSSLALGDTSAAESAATTALEDVDPRDASRVRLMAIRSDIALLRNDSAAAIAHATAAMQAARDLGDRRALAQSLSRLAAVLALSGDPVHARDRHAEALAEAEQADDVSGLATYVMNLATAEHVLGEIATAVARYEEAARLARRHGRDAVLAAALSNLGGLLAWAGADDEAMAVLAEADEAAARCGSAMYAAQAALVRAEVLGRRDPRLARAEAERARAAFVSAGVARQALEAELLDAELAARAHEADAALATLARLRSELDRSGLGGRARWAEAAAALDGDDVERARRAAEHAARIAHEHGDRELEARALDLVARVHDRLRTGAAGAYRERARAALGDAAARLPAGLRERFLAVPERAAITRAAETSSPSAAAPRGLDDRARRLLALVRKLLLEGDERRLLESAVDEAVAFTRAERAFLLTRRGAGASEVAVARNLDRESIRRARFRFSRSVAERVLDTGEPFLATRATEDPALRGAQSVLDLGLRSIVCVPVRGPSGIAGALYLDHRFEAARFDDTDLELVQALADIVGVAIENARLHRDAARHAEELERSHAMALRESQQRAMEVERLVEELSRARPGAGEPDEENGIIGRSPALRRALDVARRVAPSDVPVLIEGESGTGKELVARYLHARSARAAGTFVAVNCGALPENLLESELFGHVRGAFTGATRDHPGVFRVASGGTLLLDEVGEMPARMQTRLLRVLQEGEVRPVGGGHPLKVDVRVLAATHRDLSAEVEAGRFRRDLFYRLVGVRIALPSLRARRDDIPLLARRALDRIAREPGMRAMDLSRDAVSALVAHEWPGNVRELEHALRRAVLVADGSELSAADLALSGSGVTATRRDALTKVDRGLLEQALRGARGNRTTAARALGISRVTLHRWMKRYGVS